MLRRLRDKLGDGARFITRRKKLKKSPKNIDWGEFLHIGFNAGLPFVLVGLVNNDLTPIAVLVVFISKWRMFAMRYNHLPANIRANLTDLIVKLSTLSFIVRSEDISLQIIFAAWYAVWLLLIKPQTGRFWVSTQALISQSVGITALIWGTDSEIFSNEIVMLVGIWTVLYSTTYHFLSEFDEPLSKVIAKIWATLGIQLAWVFLHWNLVYFVVIPQYVLVQSAFSYIAADLYVQYNEDKSEGRKYRNYLFTAIIVVIVIILSGDWSGQLI